MKCFSFSHGDENGEPKTPKSTSLRSSMSNGQEGRKSGSEFTSMDMSDGSNVSSSRGHKEWVTEVNVLGFVDHPNLVKLVGYSSDDDERGIQRLLIIFRDFKSSNILLDKNWNAKLSDFGLARLGPSDELSHVSTAVVGTVGYAAPEYIQTGRLTYKSDVWSFGIFLYELITGRRPFDRNKPKNEQKLLDWSLEESSPCFEGASTPKNGVFERSMTDGLKKRLLDPVVGENK
ncbi:hypothetical protein M8C21_022400, partial [Ambrosia artemisiifolia]